MYPLSPPPWNWLRSFFFLVDFVHVRRPSPPAVPPGPLPEVMPPPLCQKAALFSPVGVVPPLVLSPPFSPLSTVAPFLLRTSSLSSRRLFANLFKCPVLF